MPLYDRELMQAEEAIRHICECLELLRLNTAVRAERIARIEERRGPAAGARIRETLSVTHEDEVALGHARRSAEAHWLHLMPEAKANTVLQRIGETRGEAVMLDLRAAVADLERGIVHTEEQRHVAECQAIVAMPADERRARLNEVKRIRGEQALERMITTIGRGIGETEARRMLQEPWTVPPANPVPASARPSSAARQQGALPARLAARLAEQEDAAAVDRSESLLSLD